MGGGGWRENPQGLLQEKQKATGGVGGQGRAVLVDPILTPGCLRLDLAREANL